MLKAIVPILALALLPLTGALAQQAQQTTPNQAYPLRSEGASAGSALYPLKKRYDSFTSAERAALRALYEGMPESDEPPFPTAGMRPIMDEVAEIAGQYKAVGFVSIFVNVDVGGNATGVRIMKSPNVDAAKAIAYVLVQAKYKPAKCGGQPCAMEFPFRFNLTL